MTAEREQSTNRDRAIASASGRAVVVAGDDIDTDRIIPARYLRCLTFDGLGPFAFYDERYDQAGNETGHPLDDPARAGANILISGRNFGCGSSREHAPQSLQKAGFDAVVAESFAEIFFGNCTTLGMICATLASEDLKRLADAVQADPEVPVCVDLASQTVRFGDQSAPFSMPNSARDALMAGEWDPLGQLLEAADAVRAVAERLPYRSWAR